MNPCYQNTSNLRYTSSLEYRDNKVSGKISCSHFLTASKGLILSAAFFLPTLILRIIGLAVSIFGTCGKKFNFFARKLHAILVVHNFENVSLLFESRALCRTKNLATKKSIWREEDVNKTHEFIKLLLDSEYRIRKQLPDIDSEKMSLLEKYDIKGAKASGICFGASLYIIKSLISNNIDTEEKLIQFVKQFENGFPSEAAALQETYEAFGNKISLETREITHEEIEETRKAISNEMDLKLKNLENMSGQLSPEEWKRLCDQIAEAEKSIYTRVEESIKKIQQRDYYGKKTDELQCVASLIDLKLKCNLEKYENKLFTSIVQDKQVQERFNQLKNNYYQLCFRTGKHSGHSIVYIKQEFGSYFLDPIFGLIKCTSDNHAEQLTEFLKKHYGRKSIGGKEWEPFLEVHRYYET